MGVQLSVRTFTLCSSSLLSLSAQHMHTHGLWLVLFSLSAISLGAWHFLFI
jgi:hypothetical protein